MIDKNNEGPEDLRKKKAADGDDEQAEGGEGDQENKEDAK
jgi:hypothetical protein